MELSEKRRRPTSTSRASRSASRAPRPAESAATYTYHSIALVGAADSKHVGTEGSGHVKGKGHGVGTEDQEHDKTKIDDVVSFDTYAIVESEVSAN